MPTPSVERRLAAILAADIGGYALNAAGHAIIIRERTSSTAKRFMQD